MIHLPYPRLCQCGVVHRPTGCCGKCTAHELRPYNGLYLTADAKNRMLDVLDESQATGMVYASLHSAFSTSGANELSGGAYQRRPLTWTAAVSGGKVLGSPLPTWNVPVTGGPTMVAWIGFWDLSSGGVFKGMLPAGAGPLLRASCETSTDVSTTTINSKAHLLTAGKQVVFWGVPPTGLSIGTIYWVRSGGLTANAFTVSATAGGAAVTLSGTQPFTFFAQQAVPEEYGAAGAYTLGGATVSLLEQAPAGSSGIVYPCTEIVGFSVTESWYGLAPFQPTPISGFIQNVPNPERWQLRWASGGSIDQWGAGSSYSGWYDSNNLISHCAVNSGAPDRVIINISGGYSNSPSQWASSIQNAIGFIWSSYSRSVQSILMQPPLDGPGGGSCPSSDPLAQPYGVVRSTYNAPYIIQGIALAQAWINSAQALNSFGPYAGAASLGATPHVAQCSDYADWAGHILSAQQARTGQELALIYG